VPQPRYEHSAVVLGSGNNAEMHLLYGRVGEDTYPNYPSVAYNFATQTWRNATASYNETADPTASDRPVTRGGQAVAVFDADPNKFSGVGDTAVMFGGECHITNHLGLPFRDTWNYTASDDGVKPTDYTFVAVEVTDFPEVRFVRLCVCVCGGGGGGGQRTHPFKQ
jgi:hypothetical protein